MFQGLHLIILKKDLKIAFIKKCFLKHILEYSLQEGVNLQKETAQKEWSRENVTW